MIQNKKGPNCTNEFSLVKARKYVIQDEDELLVWYFFNNKRPFIHLALQVKLIAIALAKDQALNE